MVQRSSAGVDRLAFIPPQLPALVEQPPSEGEWIHEVKFDGYRSQIVIDRSGVRIFTRRGHDWTIRYAPLVEAASRFSVKAAIIDGEIVVTDDRGVSDFATLRNSIAGAPERLAFVAFDLLHLDGRDMRKMPTIDRRAALERLIPDAGPIQFSQSFEGDPARIFASIEAMGLEGMVSKLARSTYRSGQSTQWLKVKCYEEADMQVLGYLRKPGTAPQAYMSRMDGKRSYAGGAFVALNRESRDAFWKRAESLTGGKPPKGIKKPEAQWLRPGLIGRVRYLKGEEELRHATLREVWESDEG